MLNLNLLIQLKGGNMIAFIQKYLIYVLLGVIVVLLIIAGFQTLRVSWKQATIEKQIGTINLQDESIKSKDKVIKAHEQNDADNLKMLKNQQEIKMQMSKIDNKIANQNNQTKCMEDKDEEIFVDIFNEYNNVLGVQPSANSEPSTRAKDVQ